MVLLFSPFSQLPCATCDFSLIGVNVGRVRKKKGKRCYHLAEPGIGGSRKFLDGAGRR